jgi:hypothetical protein
MAFAGHAVGVALTGVLLQSLHSGLTTLVFWLCFWLLGVLVLLNPPVRSTQYPVKKLGRSIRENRWRTCPIEIFLGEGSHFEAQSRRAR